MGLEEAAKILNVPSKPLPSVSVLDKAFTRHFDKNSPEKGGNIYLQSKFVRAREVFQNELDEKASDGATDNGHETTSATQASDQAQRKDGGA